MDYGLSRESQSHPLLASLARRFGASDRSRVESDCMEGKGEPESQPWARLEVGAPWLGPPSRMGGTSRW